MIGCRGVTFKEFSLIGFMGTLPPGPETLHPSFEVSGLGSKAELKGFGFWWFRLRVPRSFEFRARGF